MEPGQQERPRGPVLVQVAAQHRRARGYRGRARRSGLVVGLDRAGPGDERERPGSDKLSPARTAERTAGSRGPTRGWVSVGDDIEMTSELARNAKNPGLAAGASPWGRSSCAAMDDRTRPPGTSRG